MSTRGANQSTAWSQQQQHNQQHNQKTAGFHFGQNGQPGFWASSGQQNGNGGQQQNGQQGSGQGHRPHSPLADPEFFNSTDIRNFCENGRSLMQAIGFDIAVAAEVLEAVLKEIPDPEGKPWGSKLRARRVARRMKKTADHMTGAAKNFAATYAAFQAEFAPELQPLRQRQARAPRRTFDFNS